ALGGFASVAPSAGAASKPPARIVSLSPTSTEMLFAIGAGKHVVAVDDQSNYPAKAPRTKLSGYQPNVEAIAGYRRDLVVMSDGTIASQLRSLGIAVLVQPAAAKLDDTYRELRKLGRATGREAAASKVVAHMRSEIADIAGEVPAKRTPPSAYVEIDD